MSVTAQDLKGFTESFGFVVFFLVIVLGVSMTLGDKALFWFLVLILMGMVYTNWTKLSQIIRRYSTP